MIAGFVSEKIHRMQILKLLPCATKNIEQEGNDACFRLLCGFNTVGVSRSRSYVTRRLILSHPHCSLTRTGIDSLSSSRADELSRAIRKHRSDVMEEGRKERRRNQGQSLPLCVGTKHGDGGEAVRVIDQTNYAWNMYSEEIDRRGIDGKRGGNETTIRSASNLVRRVRRG